MSSYRLLHFSSAHFLGAEELAAAADHEAVRLAAVRARCNSVELWNGPRRVWTIVGGDCLMLPRPHPAGAS